MKYVAVLVVAIGGAGLLDAQSAKDQPAKVPALAKVVVVASRIEDVGGGGFNLGKINVSVRYVRVILTDKSWLQAGWSIDRKKPDTKEKEQRRKQVLSEMAQGGPCAIEGELLWEGDSPTLRLARVWSAQLLGLRAKSVDLVIASATKIDKQNQARFPAPGKVRVRGQAVCGQRDLKLTKQPTLAIENGKLPIVLDGELAKADARGKGSIEATGTLSMDKRGFLRLRADAVKDFKE